MSATVTDGMVEAALVIASQGRNVVEGDDATWQAELPTMATMRAVIELIAPAIRASAVEECAKVADAEMLRHDETAEKLVHAQSILAANARASVAEEIAAAIRALTGDKP